MKYCLAVVLSLLLLAGCQEEKIVGDGPEKVLTPVRDRVKVGDSLVVDGYCDRLSYGYGEVAKLFINARLRSAQPATLGVYDVNQNLVAYAQLTAVKPQKVAGDKPYEKGFGYTVNGTFTISKSLPSGLYFIAGTVPLIIRNTSAVRNKLVVVYPSNTDFAYNNAGGKSFYFPDVPNRATTVSFLRPWQIKASAMEFMRWAPELAAKGLTFDYITDRDLDNYETIRAAKVLVLAGHSEYWTRQARLNFDAFVNAGGNAAILSGNTMWWQVRYNSSANQLICYKYDAAARDPEPNKLLKTQNWNNSSLQFPLVPSTGVDYSLGGFANSVWSFKGGYKVISQQSPLLTDTGIERGGFIPLEQRHEYDGTYVTYRKTGQDSLPVVDRSRVTHYKYELVAYMHTHLDQDPKKKGIGVFTVSQRTAKSGIIVNTGSDVWCDGVLKLPKGQKNRQITLNILTRLVNRQPVFSAE